jgi:hypothetical protein
MSGEEGAPQVEGPLHRAAHGPPPRAGEEWAAALRAFREARAEVDAVERRSAGLSVVEEEAWMPAHEAACAAMEGALGRVVRAAAPDLAALGEKMGLVFDFAVEPGAVEAAGVVAALMADGAGGGGGGGSCGVGARDGA